MTATQENETEIALLNLAAEAGNRSILGAQVLGTLREILDGASEHISASGVTNIAAAIDAEIEVIEKVIGHGVLAAERKRSIVLMRKHEQQTEQ